MKKNILYIAMVVFSISMLFLIIYKYQQNAGNEPDNYVILERKGIAAKDPAWPQVKNQAVALIEVIQNHPEDVKPKTKLAILYIQEARITGNYTYYDKAAMKYVNDALSIDSTDFDAMLLKSLLYLSQHHFADGLELAQKIKAISPYNSYVYGLCVDGNVEMGNYKAAVDDADKMLSIRPDIRSYSRASYLREIYGNYPGAIEAMKMAVDAGYPGEEATEWARIQLGHLYENTGDLANAEMHYTIALQERPGYAYALAGLGRIAAAKKDYTKAVQYFQQADTSVMDYSFKEALAEVYRQQGNKSKADAIEKGVIAAMTKDAESGMKDANIGHYVDKELAYAYLNINDVDDAEKHALLEYNRRPDNIDVNECLAWVYYSKGEYQKAVTYIKAALKTNCKNPTLLCRAGLIYAKAGNKALAKTTLQTALQTNANITEHLKTEGKNILQAL
ncbi:tetratricopeptide repeat protein [Ilyomonas limi]|uniref:Tetratricopeptide repeat protein n=1 Tax=Ilyomonas limi TaxID=2575867 RepID=A0A4U3KU87_9BACT|nr:tetratricopeptide repeat protein [Ilyomonas limi]TKK66105.1 tetratricopeptide repeat protein [Ilyomonas limi]